MKIINSVFEKSSKTIDQCPNKSLPEFAFVGRSNVGKSSLINSLLNNKLDESVIKNIIEEAVTIEKEFITESIPCKLIGMNSDMMKEYIEFVSDRLLVQLGYEKIWNTSNPFDFMEMISLRPKSNFFEIRVGEYAKSTISENNETFEINNDF